MQAGIRASAAGDGCDRATAATIDSVRALRVTVKPNAPTATLTERDDGTWRATVKAPPVDGKANRELCRLVAQHFGLRPSQVTIKSGAGARIKTIVIDDG